MTDAPGAAAHPHGNDLVRDLALRAARIRKDIVQIVYDAGSGHPGGSLSCTDILVSLYFHHLRHQPLNPKWPDRDRFVMSKGQASPGLYAVLAMAGYIPHDELRTFRKANSRLQGHVEINVPGVEFTTGSLGQGLSGAVGMALAGRLDKKDYRVYAVLGDGECQEGQIWEAAMAAAHFKLNSLVAILDRNGLQIDGPTEQIMALADIAAKWRGFGWEVLDIDGHELPQILEALHKADAVADKPTIIIAHTVKGKGVSFMEGSTSWHGRPPNKDEYTKAMVELDDAIEKANVAMGAVAS